MTKWKHPSCPHPKPPAPCPGESICFKPLERFVKTAVLARGSKLPASSAAKAGGLGSIPGPGRSHMPWGDYVVCATQLLSLGSRPRAVWQEQPLQWEARAAKLGSTPCLLQPEKAGTAMKTQQSQKSIKKKNFFFSKTSRPATGSQASTGKDVPVLFSSSTMTEHLREFLFVCLFFLSFTALCYSSCVASELKRLFAPPHEAFIFLLRHFATSDGERAVEGTGGRCRFSNKVAFGLVETWKPAWCWRVSFGIKETQGNIQSTIT